MLTAILTHLTAAAVGLFVGLLFGMVARDSLEHAAAEDATPATTPSVPRSPQPVTPGPRP